MMNVLVYFLYLLGHWSTGIHFPPFSDSINPFLQTHEFNLHVKMQGPGFGFAQVAWQKEAHSTFSAFGSLQGGAKRILK